MNATSRAILQSVISSDEELTVSEAKGLEQILAGESLGSPAGGSAPTQLLTQQQVAERLCLHRATVWRLTKQGFFHPIEVTPCTLRYQSFEIEAFARNGFPRKTAHGRRSPVAKAAA